MLRLLGRLVTWIAPSLVFCALGILPWLLYFPHAHADVGKSITYDASSSTLEIDLDTFAPECKDRMVLVMISDDRTGTRVSCDKSAFDLPVIQGSHIKLTYSRHPATPPPPSP